MQERYLDEYIRKLRESNSITDCEAVPVEEVSDKQDFLFISYSHKDYKLVYEDLAVMSCKGVRFWYDEGLRAGKHWDEEVKRILLHPHCVGVIFFLSENLFLSKSVNEEINLVCAKDIGYAKPYFSVNLADGNPSHIVRSVMRMDDTVLDQAGLNMERLAALASSFSDKMTYLPFSVPKHRDSLIREIKKQFSSAVEEFSPREDYFNRKDDYSNFRYLTRKDTGECIPLNHNVFRIGRDQKWSDYCLSYPFAGREHCSIICAEGDAWILDHQSTNGTYINGKQIKRSKMMKLFDGDEIRIGTDVILVFHVEKIDPKEIKKWKTCVSLLGSTSAGKTVSIVSYAKQLEEEYQK